MLITKTEQTAKLPQQMQNLLGYNETRGNNYDYNSDISIPGKIRKIFSNIGLNSIPGEISSENADLLYNELSALLENSINTIKQDPNQDGVLKEHMNMVVSIEVLKQIWSQLGLDSKDLLEEYFDVTRPDDIKIPIPNGIESSVWNQCVTAIQYELKQHLPFFSLSNTTNIIKPVPNKTGSIAKDFSKTNAVNGKKYAEDIRETNDVETKCKNYQERFSKLYENANYELLNQQYSDRLLRLSEEEITDKKWLELIIEVAVLQHKFTKINDSLRGEMAESNIAASKAHIKENKDQSINPQESLKNAAKIDIYATTTHFPPQENSQLSILKKSFPQFIQTKFDRSGLDLCAYIDNERNKQPYNSRDYSKNAFDVIKGFVTSIQSHYQHTRMYSETSETSRLPSA